MVPFHSPERSEMTMKAANDTRNCSDGLEADSMVIILFAKESMNKDAQKLHHAFRKRIHKVLWFVVKRFAYLFQISDRKTRRKSL